jgi:carbon monoxide dehydrogenase subunit G
MRTSSILSAITALVLSLSATAQELDRVTIGDLPGTNGSWQTGEVVVAAPAAEVQQWLSDAPDWPARFPDVEWAHALGTTEDGRRIVQFRSRAIGRPITIRVREQPGLIAYDGEGKDVTTRGKNYIERLGERRTRVVLQTTAEVHGAAGAFASEKMKRERARRKLSADLDALVELAHRQAATDR